MNFNLNCIDYVLKFSLIKNYVMPKYLALNYSWGVEAKEKYLGAVS